MELVLTLKWPWITHLDLDLSVSHVSWFQHTLPLMLDSEYVFHWGIGPFCRAAVLSLLGTKASIMEDNFLFLTNRTRGMVWEGFKHIYGSCSCDNLMLLLIRKEVELRWSGEWRGAAISTDEASLTHPPFTHCGATQFLTSTCGTDLVFGDPCGRVLTRKTNILSNGWVHWLISCVEEKQLLCGMLRSHSKNRWLILGHYQLPLLMLLHIPLSTIKVFTLGLPRKTATHPLLHPMTQPRVKPNTASTWISQILQSNHWHGGEP